jgi:hypothetical protein
MSTVPLFVLLYARLVTLLWVHFGALPSLLRTGTTVRCAALTLDGRVRADLPTGTGATPEDAVQAVLDAYDRALPWEPWYVPRGVAPHAATDGARGGDAREHDATPTYAHGATIDTDGTVTDLATGHVDRPATARAEVA